MNEYIDINPNTAFGRPRIRRTTISVNFILDLLSISWTIEDILEHYPQLTREKVHAAIKFVQHDAEAPR